MASSPAVESSPGYVVCYYSSWAHYRKGLARYTVEDIPVELCTHLIYAFATLDSKTYLAKPFDPWLDVDLKNYEKFVKLKEKNPKMKVLLGVGGWNDSRSNKYSIMVADASKRRRFAKEVVKLLLEYGFDGLDLDWEYPGYESKREDKEGFTHWVEDLKTALSPHGMLLTTAVGAAKRVIDRGYDVPRIMKHFDFINVMAYDFHGSWERVVAHHSPLYPEKGQNPEFNADFAVNYWIQKGAPANKIVLGVPLYGRSWTLASSSNSPGSPASGAGKQGKYVKERGHMAYFECCLAHQQDGWAKITGDGGPYLTKDDQWVGYDDVEAVVKKAQYALEKGLGGIMVWDTVSDDFSNACGQGHNPLLTAINRTLQGDPPPKGSASSSTSPPPRDPPSDAGSRSSNFIRAFPWTQPVAGNGGSGNVIGGTSSIKSSSFGGGTSQNSDLPYEWLAWPIFSNSPPTNQNVQSNTGSQFVTPPSVTTSTRFGSPFTSRFSNNLGGTTTRGSIGSGLEQTTKPPYDWLSWPIFSNAQPDNNNVQSNTGSQFVSPPSVSSSTSRFSNNVGGTTNKVSGTSVPGQTNKQYYDWQSWPIFSNNGQQSDQNTVSNSGSQFVTSPPPVSSSTSFGFPTTSRFSSKPGGTGNLGSSGSGVGAGVGSGQTTRSPYVWQSWPIFNNGQQSNQNTVPNSGSQFVTSPPLVSSSTSFSFPTTSRFSSKPGGTGNLGSSGSGVGSGQTTRSPYVWQSWPIFNDSPGNDQNKLPSTGASSSVTTPSTTSTKVPFSSTSRFSFKTQGTTTKRPNVFGGGFSQTTKPPYDWLSWPVFSNSPENTRNSISSNSIRTNSFTTTVKPVSSFANFPSLRSKFSSVSSAASWFADCKSVGFAPDPTSCNAFYRCTDHHAYRFDCPSGLLWRQEESSCDWPDAVQCILPVSKPNIAPFLAAKS
ncbi:oviduct-specific glycoprotein-like isoform X2 [Palaemon carinicauda]|uniref:oviduct-specific glycoprotein-like isoform X2 n=1 Tax=Palaemon carinicauda TaxID=392227 RepID=UPI0035B5A4B9